jgi:predicted transcriptional regulator
MDTKQITSFIVRFQLTDIEEESNEKHWRIKVTHVQDEYENLFESIEEAMLFMKQKVEDS